MYPNRTICDMLKELRKCNDTRNFSYFLGLVEEIQSAAERMEAKLHDVKDLKYVRQDTKELKEERRQLKAEIDALEKLRDMVKS